MTRLLLRTFAAAILALSGSGALAGATEPGGDINALPSGPKAPTARSNQSEAEAAYEQARAECRRVPREERRDCVKRVQRDNDKALRLPKPPTLRAPRPAPPASG